jgi:hypothetical protein
MKAVPTALELGGKKVEARTAHFDPVTRTLDLAPLLGAKGDPMVGRAAFVYIPFELPEGGETTFGFGADWWYAAYLDGQLISETISRKKGNEKWPPNITDHKVTVKIPAGKHVLVIRFLSGLGSSVLAVGGNHITNDIAAGLRTPLMAAERIKCEYGTAVTAGVSKADIIEVPSVGGRPPRVLSKLVLAEIIEPRIVEMFGLIQREIIRAGCEDLLTSGAVLTGGSANLPGIAQVAEHVFNLPVRIGTPTAVGGLLDLIKGPEYAAAVGLVQHGASQNLLSRRSSGTSRGVVSNTVRRVVGWFTEHF